MSGASEELMCLLEMIQEQDEKIEQMQKAHEQEMIQLAADLQREMNIKEAFPRAMPEPPPETSLEKEPGEESKLPGDIYSFYAFVDYFDGWRPRLSFSIALIVFSVQVLTFSLFAVDVIDIHQGDNPLGIPAGVDNVVRFSQVIALLITAISQDEFQLSLNVLATGYDGNAVTQFSGTLTAFKWYFSIMARLTVGMLSFAVTFMLIIRSDTVRDLMLDFTAVSFVSQIDNGAFLLATWGYLGRKVQFEAEEIANVSILDQSKEGIFSRRLKIPRFASLILTMFGLILAWFILTIKQLDGAYVDHTIDVQFGDDFWPALATFSGLYELQLGSFWSGGRDMYYQERRDVPGTAYRARFTYCEQLSAWVFQIGVDRNTGGLLPNLDCTVDYIARSSETFTFDLVETVLDDWLFNDEGSSQDMAMQHFVIHSQNDYTGKTCATDADCGDRYECLPTAKGVNTCFCLDKRAGIDCEFVTACVNLEIDPSSSTGDVIGFDSTGPWSRAFKTISDPVDGQPYSVYHKPIYIGKEETAGGNFDIMIFTGRRWILTRTDVMHDFDGVPLNRSYVATYLADNFHDYWSDYQFAFISAEVDVGTPSSAATPVGLTWMLVEAGTTMKTWQAFRDQSSDALLLCANCADRDNPCLLGGICHADQTCECVEGSYGTLCQITPISDGKCNSFFNFLSFQYDGGDCCQRSCTGSEGTFTCGYETLPSFTGLAVNQYVGYNCIDPLEICNPSQATCLIPLYETIDNENGIGWESLISGNGAVWVSYNFDSQSVWVQEQVGATYQTRGNPFFNINGTYSFALSHDGTTLAMGSKEDGVTVYGWESRNRLWQPVGSKFAFNSFKSPASMSLSADGTTFAIGYSGLMSPDMVDVYKFDRSLYEWQQLVDLPVELLSKNSLVALSDDGNRLAVRLEGNASISVSGDTSNFTFVGDIVSVYEYGVDQWTKMGGNMEAGLSDEVIAWHAFSGAGDRVATVSNFSKTQNVTVCQTEAPLRPGLVDEDEEECEIVSQKTWHRHLVFYDYNAQTNLWESSGDFEFPDSGAEAGPSLSLSGDGSMVAVGMLSTGARKIASVNFYNYEDATKSWTVSPDPVSLGVSDRGFLPSVSLSHDASTIVIGKYDSASSELVYAYQSLAISTSDASPTSNASQNLVALSFVIQMDDYPEETAISLICDGVTYGSPFVGRYYTVKENVEGVLQVPSAASCEFVIYDSKNDGLCCGYGEGSYEIYFGEGADRALIAKGGGLTFGSMEKVTFVASPPTDLIPVTVQIDAVDMINKTASISTHLICDGAFESAAPVNHLGDISQLQFGSNSTFLVPDGTECEFNVQLGSSFPYCQNCSVAYSIFQEGAGGQRTQLLQHQFFPWMTKSKVSRFSVTSVPAELAPVTLVMNPDTFATDSSFILSCGTELGFSSKVVDSSYLLDNSDGPVMFSSGFFSAKDFTPSHFAYIATFHVPVGSLCVLSVTDVAGDGFCCKNGKGYYQVHYSSMENISPESLIYEGSRFNKMETVFFEAAAPSTTSELVVSFQLDENEHETSFSLECASGVNANVSMDDLGLGSYDMADFVYFVPDASDCMLHVEDSRGDGLVGGFYEVFTETDAILYNGLFAGYNLTHDLSVPPTLVPLTVVVEGTTTDITNSTFEMRCGDGYVYAGFVIDMPPNGLTFRVVENAYCQFSLLDPTGGDMGLSFGLYYSEGNEGPESPNLIYQGGSFQDSLTAVFQAASPVLSVTPLTVRFDISDKYIDQAIDLQCYSVPYLGVNLNGFTGLKVSDLSTEVFLIPNVEDCRLLMQSGGSFEGHYQVYYGSSLLQEASRVYGVNEFISSMLPTLVTDGVPLSFIGPLKEFTFIAYVIPTWITIDSASPFLTATDDPEIFTRTVYVKEGSLIEISTEKVEKLRAYYATVENASQENEIFAIDDERDETEVFLFQVYNPSLVTGISVDVSVELVLDLYFWETYLTLNCKNEALPIPEFDAYYEPYYLTSYTAWPDIGRSLVIVTFPSIPIESECILTLGDSYGDGIIAPGGYRVSVAGGVVAESFGSSFETLEFPLDLQTQSPTLSPAPSPAPTTCGSGLTLWERLQEQKFTILHYQDDKCYRMTFGNSDGTFQGLESSINATCPTSDYDYSSSNATTLFGKFSGFANNRANYGNGTSCTYALPNPTASIALSENPYLESFQVTVDYLSPCDPIFAQVEFPSCTPFVCKDHQDQFELRFFTDSFPDENSWYLYNLDNEVNVTSVDLYNATTDEKKVFQYHECLDPGSYQFVMSDSARDGLAAYGEFSLYINGELLAGPMYDFESNANVAFEV